MPFQCSAGSPFRGSSPQALIGSMQCLLTFLYGQQSSPVLLGRVMRALAATNSSLSAAASAGIHFGDGSSDADGDGSRSDDVSGAGGDANDSSSGGDGMHGGGGGRDEGGSGASSAGGSGGCGPPSGGGNRATGAASAAARAEEALDILMKGFLRRVLVRRSMTCVVNECRLPGRRTLQPLKAERLVYPWAWPLVSSWALSLIVGFLCISCTPLGSLRDFFLPLPRSLPWPPFLLSFPAYNILPPSHTHTIQLASLPLQLKPSQCGRSTSHAPARCSMASCVPRCSR